MPYLQQQQQRDQ